MAVGEGASPGEGGKAGRPPVRLPVEPFVATSRLVVLFDGDCSFCRWAIERAVRWDRRRDGRRLLEPLDLHRAAEAPDSAVRAAAERFDLGTALTVVEPSSGRTARGGDAVLSIAAILPGGRAIRPALGLLPFRVVVGLAYRAVATARPLLARLGMAR